MKIRFAAALLAVVAAPLLADPGYFPLVRKGQMVRLTVAAGYCDAKVLQRAPDQLTLKLRRTTAACGRGGATILVSRSNVRDVVRLAPQPRRQLLVQAATAPVQLVVELIVDAGVAAVAFVMLIRAPIAVALHRPHPPRFEILANQIQPSP